MSWKTINYILGLTSIDPRFHQALRDDPLAALETQDIELTPREKEVFLKYHTLPFSQFCECLLRELPSEDNS